MTDKLPLPPAPALEGALKDQLRAFSDAAAALPRDAASRALLRASERLSAWSEAAGALDDAALASGAPVSSGSRYGCMGSAIVAADNVARSLHYVDMVVLPNQEGERIGHTTQLQTLSGIHDIQHRANLDKVRFPEGPVSFTPGQPRSWAGRLEDSRTGETHTPPPAEAVPGLMQTWSDAYGPQAWEGRPAVLRAAQAYASLQAIQPYPDGNGRVARAVAHGILTENGYPATGLHAVLERHRPRHNARLMDAIRTGEQDDWSRGFVEFAREGMEMLPRHLPEMKEGVVQLASHISQKAGLDHPQRHKMALSMMTLPVDRPNTFAQRHGLDRDTAETILKPLVRSGQVTLGRVNGQQVMVTQPALSLVRSMVRPPLERTHDRPAPRPDRRTDGEAR